MLRKHQTVEDTAVLNCDTLEEDSNLRKAQAVEFPRREGVKSLDYG